MGVNHRRGVARQELIAEMALSRLWKKPKAGAKAAPAPAKRYEPRNGDYAASSFEGKVYMFSSSYAVHAETFDPSTELWLQQKTDGELTYHPMSAAASDSHIYAISEARGAGIDPFKISSSFTDLAEAKTWLHGVWYRW